MEKLERIRILLKIAINVLQIIENELENKLERMEKDEHKLETGSESGYLSDRDYNNFTHEEMTINK